MFRAVVVAAVMILAALQGARADSVLRLPYEVGYGGAETMDPYDANRFWPPIDMVFSRLIAGDENAQPVPELATSWSSSADLKLWTLKLRSGVKFHDGSPFTADDVVYSIKRMIDPKFDSPVRAVLGVIKDVRAVDPLTIELELSQAEADLPLLLMDYRVLMTKKDSAATIKEKPIGTGPFMVKTIAPQGTTVLVANPNYFLGKPGVDRIELIAIPDSAAQVQALLAGQIDYIGSLDAKQAALFANNPQFTIQHIETGHWNGLVMRTDTPPFNDVRVRKAFRIAVDRQALTTLVLGQGGGVPACDTPVSPGDPYYWAGSCPKDAAEAKRLLAEAGYPNGLDVDLYTSDVEEYFVSLAEAYQEQVKDAGIRVHLVMSASDGYWDDVWMKKPFVVTSWDQRPASQILNEAYRSGADWNETFWNRPDFDALLDKARSEPDFDKRKADYQEIQKVLFEEGGALIPFHKNIVRVFRSNVKHIDPVVADQLRWEKITVQ